MILYRSSKGAVPGAWFIPISRQGNWYSWLSITKRDELFLEEIKINGSHISGGNSATKGDLRRLVRYLFYLDLKYEAT
jgi:hypothetical protein